jgi:hypothetical protein
LLRDYKNKNVDHTYKYEELSIKKSLEEDKAQIYDKYVSKLEREIKQLENSRRQFLLDYNWYQLTANGASLDELDQEQNDLLFKFHSHNLQSELETMEENSFMSAKSKEEREIEEELKLLQRLTGKQQKANDSTTTPSSIKNSSCISPVNLQGTPYVVYSLQDYEILEDLFAIKMHSNNLNSLSAKKQNA